MATSSAAWQRWLVIGAAACVALAGCQSMVVRSQGPLEAPETQPGESFDARAFSPPARSGNRGGVSRPLANSARTNIVQPLAATEPLEAPTAPLPDQPLPHPQQAGSAPIHGVPSELRKTSLPTYVIEPPDILLIDALKVVPKPPYRVEALDVLQIIVLGTLEGQDIGGQYVVDPNGMVDLGPSYGKVHVAGMSVEEATEVVTKNLKRILRQPEVSLTLVQSSGQQQIAGEHLVGPDGTVNLGTYGRIYVAGMTLAQAKAAIEQQLGEYLLEPRVSIDVFAYNSKKYYIVLQGAGLGDQVVDVPITGNETVLDAISEIGGLRQTSSKKIWIARPTPGAAGCVQTLPVDWNGITAGAATATNYQILPGDRVFVSENKMVAFDNFITRITGPFERMFGFGLLSAQTLQTINRFPDGQGGIGGNNF